MIRLLVSLCFLTVFSNTADADPRADCEQTRSPAKTIESCSQLIRADKFEGKKLAITHYNRGVAFHKTGDFAMAISDFSKALALDPGRSEIFYNRGTAYMADRQYDLAVRDFSRALALDPASIKALNNRAWAYMKWGKPKRGLDDANRALKLRPKAARVIDTRGHIHEALGDRKQAIADFKSALVEAPKLASAKAGLKRLGAD
jgi:tetratricopeptide (TPR) repeat protein